MTDTRKLVKIALTKQRVMEQRLSYLPACIRESTSRNADRMVLSADADSLYLEAGVIYELLQEILESLPGEES